MELPVSLPSAVVAMSQRFMRTMVVAFGVPLHSARGYMVMTAYCLGRGVGAMVGTGVGLVGVAVGRGVGIEVSPGSGVRYMKPFPEQRDEPLTLVVNVHPRRKLQELEPPPPPTPP